MHGSENVFGRLDAARRPASFSEYGETDKHSNSCKHSLKLKGKTGLHVYYHILFFFYLIVTIYCSVITTEPPTFLFTVKCFLAVKK